MRLTALTLPVLLALAAPPAFAVEDSTWTDLAAQLYGDRELLDGKDVIAIDAPYRTDNDPRTQVAAQVAAPPGRMLGKVTLILDENPMPVSAVFEMDRPQERFFFDVTMRVNGPTPLHVVAETTDGQLYVAEAFVKTSGTGACAAPPGTDPELALATLGNMTIGIEETVGGSASEKLSALSLRQRRLDLDISHPSHSGMQMDQISLLFIPMRYVENVEIDLDGAGYVDMTGSISLSENPQVSLSVPGQTQQVDVTMTDTDGTVTHASKTLPGY
ncbi:quinoprotein dehydrogenase-associated SoxYZ-like carrier [Thalassococcus profundi]|uniref:Quinoprotein dehydrogenase-associated SoxYZ-like carrier n=1 Tax=Thalassococcus profundi TaxID=2282382 RepID=A0A369TFF6_9RHOB|nr:quinoprotein dehydrogenase-associated SoxYZ-like carrier [Thalassococcus profundi]RDD64079.1 quinoprotein dehydrogenase-associated SoxYZ-like carrier [Thalassococcus profundi]